jgi:hypothetical protein
MKEKINKAKTIIKAFTNDLPIGEAWYEKRLEICSTCELNSHNKEDGDLSFTEKIMTGSLCKEKGQCTACGCCIAEKTSVKSMNCGLAEVGKVPKWKAIEVESRKGNLVLEIVGEAGEIKQHNNGFLYDFGVVPMIVAKGGFKIKSQDPITYIKYAVGCGCTHPSSIAAEDDKTILVNVDISTLNFREGINEKTLTIYYKGKKGAIEEVDITFRIIKQYS